METEGFGRRGSCDDVGRGQDLRWERFGAEEDGSWRWGDGSALGSRAGRDLGVGRKSVNPGIGERTRQGLGKRDGTGVC